MKKAITEPIYREIADKLRTRLKDQVYWAGSIKGADWLFIVSCIKSGNSIAPVWWEFFYIEENGNVVADDFSFELLKQYVVWQR